MRRLIPEPLIQVVSEELRNVFYSKSKTDKLFINADAPGESPGGDVKDKCISWFKRINKTQGNDPILILYRIICPLMETDVGDSKEKLLKAREKIQEKLAEYKFEYTKNGIISKGSEAPSVADLENILRKRDVNSLDSEFKRALDALESDPPAAVTAACSILESLFKVIVEDEKLKMQGKQSIDNLKQLVFDYLELNPGKAKLEENDIHKVLSGLLTVIHGIGDLRTHAGSAHGRGNDAFHVKPKHARLMVYASSALCIFILETWDDKKNSN